MAYPVSPRTKVLRVFLGGFVQFLFLPRTFGHVCEAMYKLRQDDKPDKGNQQQLVRRKPGHARHVEIVTMNRLLLATSRLVYLTLERFFVGYVKVE